MSKTFVFILLGASIIFHCCKSELTQNQENTTSIQIAFGSCGSHKAPLPLLNVASDLNPDAFIFLGDNVYGDTRNMALLQAKYDTLGAREEFKNLWNTTEVLATWDDHDYGENDAGRYYPKKKESKDIFMKFWQVPDDSEMRKREGIYVTKYIDKNDLKIQIILLDTRTFRDDLLHRKPADSILHKNDYVPNLEADSTFLGEAQWAWLEKELLRKADVRIIASSNQFSHEYNGWESWTNVPKEQQKMINLISKTKADGVVFISGDVHWGEISKLNLNEGYPLYDVTSSGIVQTWPNVEPNKNRIGEAIPQNNIGVIKITKASKTSIEMAIIDSSAKPVVSTAIDLKEISF